MDCNEQVNTGNHYLYIVTVHGHTGMVACTATMTLSTLDIHSRSGDH